MEAADLIISSFDSFIEKGPLKTEDDEYDEYDYSFYPSFDPIVVLDLLDLTIQKLSTGKALIEVTSPIVIVGDLHGNIADLIKILHAFGKPPDRKYMFLGDFVDRGNNSLAVILLILAYMVKYEGSVFLIRGNHEFSHINRAYGFYDEIMNEYNDEQIWIKFQDVFSWFPLAAVINRAVFCVHGGLSPNLTDLDTLRQLPMPIPNYLSNTMISDLVWSDPVDTIKGFQINHRGSGQIFGPDVVESFLKNNKLKLMVRGHQCTLSGFRAFADFMGITVFSSSNYCLGLENKCGAVTVNAERTMSFFSFDDSEDSEITPRAVMSLPLDGDVGLKRVFRAISRPDFRPLQSNSTAPSSENPPLSPRTQQSKNDAEENQMHRSMSVLENFFGTA